MIGTVCSVPDGVRVTVLVNVFVCVTGRFTFVVMVVKMVFVAPTVVVTSEVTKLVWVRVCVVKSPLVMTMVSVANAVSNRVLKLVKGMTCVCWKKVVLKMFWPMET